MPDGDLFLALREALGSVEGEDNGRFTAQCPAGGHRLVVRRGPDRSAFVACPTCGGGAGPALAQLLGVPLHVAPTAVEPPLYHRLAELLDDPAALQPPEAVAERFAWRGRVAMLAAREKAGKTTLVAYVAARVSAGGTVLG